MCGIVGLVSKGNSGFFKNQLDVFHELLYVDNFRGDDSTGVFMVDRDGDLELAKSSNSAPDYQREKEYHELMRRAFSKGKAIIGHNRKATKGSITDENAHPFVVDNRIILVHNGTLFGDYKKLVPEGESVEVDSHAIAHLIHKHEDDVGAAMQEIQGAYTLVWFDMKKQTLNFLRNSQRPLAFMETSDSYIFASEKNMLTWMVDRHNLKVVQPPVELGEGLQSIFTLKTNGLWDVETQKIELTKPGTVATTAYDWYNTDDYSCGLGAVARQYPSIDEQALAEERRTVELCASDRTGLRLALAKMEERSTAYERASNDHVSKERRNRLQNHQAIRKEEERYALKASAHISNDKFSQLGGDFIDQNRYPAKCFDYNYSNGVDGAEGYFLYAWLSNSDNFMVRAFVPPEFQELKLTDLTAHQRSISLKITGRYWRAFEHHSDKNADGDGFGMFLGTEVKRILSMKEAMNREEVGTGSE